MLNCDMPRALVAGQNRAHPRFLTIISTLTMGGTERAAVNYALGYRRFGCPSAVLAYHGAGPRRAVLDSAGIEVFVGGRDETSLDAAVELARQWRPDILHIHRPGIPDAVSAAIVRSMIHPSLRVFETNVFGYVDDSPDRELFDIHLQLSRWCLWKWRGVADALRPPSLSVVVPYSVDVGSFVAGGADERTQTRHSLRIPAEALVYGRVGQPDMIKWSPWFVEAFARVASLRKDAWLLVVGLPRALEEKIERLPAEVRARIVQVPPIADDRKLRGYYAAMDVFVHVSRKGESFGMVLCEAMLSRLPVITVSTPLRDNSQIEVVRNGTAGLVVSSRAGLTEAMLRLADDRDLRGRLAEAGPSWVETQYSIAAVTPKLITLARIALAAGSQQELASTIGGSPDYKSSLSNDTVGAIYEDSNLPSPPLTSALAGWVNSRFSRYAIAWVRSVQQSLKRARWKRAT
jgi:glycosyltransferase involved in cell wall biosynthesis